VLLEVVVLVTTQMVQMVVVQEATIRVMVALHLANTIMVHLEAQEL
jgi:hypothetical protein